MLRTPAPFIGALGLIRKVVDSAAIYPRLIRRVRALLIDSAFGLVIGLTWWASLPLLVDAPGAAKLAYPIIAFAVLEPVLVALTGGTSGHHIMGIRVQSARTGERIGLARSLLRAVLRVVFGWLSFVLALTTPKRQAIHDLCVGTVVVLRDPAALPASERLPELRPDLENFAYPSKLRRGLAVFIYMIGATAVYIATVAAVMPESCLNNGRCTFGEQAAYNGLAWTWLFSCAALIVHGCHGKLFGARRKMRPLGNEP